MKTSSLVIADVTLLATTSAHAIDAKYRRLLERSGCTQVTETQGCDINKTKAQNAKAGFGSTAPADSSAASGTRVAEKACLAKVAKTVGKPSSTLKVTEVLAGLCLAVAMIATAPAVAAVQDVQFARGASSATVSGSITGRDDNRYRVRAQEGQTIKVTLKPQRPTTYFNVNPPGSDQSIFVGSSEGKVYEGRLSASGVYEIVIYQMGGAASDNRKSGYKLTVAVTGGGAGGGSAAATFSAGQTVAIGGARSDAVDAVELRDGPGRGGVVGRVGNGRLMTVDNCEGDWCHVRTMTGSSAAGWVESRYLRSK